MDGVHREEALFIDVASASGRDAWLGVHTENDEWAVEAAEKSNEDS